jgi:PIN domain nuclease of toxin-antitoxin system
MPSADTILIDTHVLLWWQAGGERLSRRATAQLSGAQRVAISTITCWEVAMLLGKDRIALDRPVRAWINDWATTTRATMIDVSADIAVSAAELPDFHGDPADRLIYATALAHGLPLISKDERLRTYARSARDLTVIW